MPLACVQSGSTTSAVVQGSLNALSSGILIYLSLVDMMKEEFSRPAAKSSPLLQLQMVFAMLLGAGVMSVLAIWA
jgi:solute carrier family 39 (zinc transporter), member 1/2/3